MESLRSFLRRHSLGIAFGCVLVPLAVLLAVQSVWLARLETVSAVAHRAALGNVLEAVRNKVQYHYRSAGERLLNLSPGMFTSGRLPTAAWYWKKRPQEGISRLFVVDFTRERAGNFFVFDPDAVELRPMPASDESLAIIVASMPWQMASYRGGSQEAFALIADERDPQFRMILNPVSDEDSRVVGVVGMILDERWFRTELLPGVLEKVLKGALPSGASEEVAIRISDGRGRRVVERGEFDRKGIGIAGKLAFVFTDWNLELATPPAAAERWAKASFAFNMTLLALLAGALGAGLVLAYRTTHRAMKLSKMKSDFVSNVSHELRTPVASIRVFGELLKLGRVGSSERVREYGAYIEAESRRLSRLVDNILDFSRIESGGKTYAFAPGDLRGTVEAVLETFSVRLKQEGFTLDYAPPPSPFPAVAFDADAVGQALHNLLDNAVKYSGESKTIRVRLFEENGDAVVAVSDDGIGIPRTEHRRIFDRFHRAGSSLVHDVKGSGLGLAIVRHIVEAHHGRVEVESEIGKGSTFLLRFPTAAGA